VSPDTPGPFLVVGASGPTGGEVVTALARRGARVRGLARSAESGERAKARGADDIALADLRDGPALERALDGVAGAFYFCPRAAPDEAAVGRAFIETAERMGVGRVVIISMIQSHAPVPNHRASLEVEEALARTPMETVVLQPGMFMQTLPSLEEIAESGWVGRPYPTDKLLTFVDLRDMAEIAAKALIEPGLVNGSFELCAQGMLSIADIADIISKHLGKTIEAREITLDEWAAVRGEAFSSPYRREVYTAMFEHFRHYGYKGGNGTVLRHLLGREPTTFEQYVARGGKTAPPPTNP
jgi:uncharacterized protein YbjT (DUF2867 family)